MSLGEERGFTLIETLVAAVLMVVVVGAAMTLYEVLISQTRETDARNEAQNIARRGIDTLSKELRNLAASDSDLPTALERAEPFDLIFQTVHETDGPVRMRYCLATNGVLYAQPQALPAPPTPLPPPPGVACPSPALPKRAVAEHVVNVLPGPPVVSRDLFSYSATNSSGQDFGVAAPTGPSDYRVIESKLWVDLDSAKRPPEARLSSQVFLRNQNAKPRARIDPPNASVPGQVLLNGSGSYDAEGDNLTYEWYDGGALLPEQGPSVTLTGVAAGLHTFKLKVYDESGLTGEATYSVTVT